jgi:hypothetical protein
MTLPTTNRRAADFRDFLSEIGVTQAQMDAAALTLPAPIHVASDCRHRVSPSAIEGLGVFSGSGLKTGEHVCTLMVGSGWTTCGRYINHDPDPNSVAVLVREGLIGMAARQINDGDEITLNYRQVRDALLARHEGRGRLDPTGAAGPPMNTSSNRSGTTRRGLSDDYAGDDPDSCNAPTKSGRPCRALALYSGRCKLHGGFSDGSRPAKGKAMVARNLRLARERLVEQVEAVLSRVRR